LVREGLKTLIADMRFDEIVERESIKAAVEQPVGDVVLVLLDAPLRADLIERFKSLRVAYPEARLVCYTPSASLPLDILNDIFGSTFNGCLLSNSSSQALRQSLDLIMMGETVLPYSLITASFSSESRPAQAEPPSVEDAFSGRELEVLTILQEGKSNKTIARELGLSEATIKVHLKNVLRKLGASNRTEAAIWMTKHRRTFAVRPRLHGPVLESRASNSSFDTLAVEDY
jgi:two-component system nitrate/nitrite response regulator NarL